MGYEKEAYLHFHNTGKKRFSKRAHQNSNANVLARSDVTFWALGYPPPPGVPTSFSHILCKYENTNMQKDKLGLKGLVGTKRISWGMMF